MAALRANTIQSTTNMSKIQRLKFQIPEKCVVENKPKKKPINAKGIAKMVWLNLMRER